MSSASLPHVKDLVRRSAVPLAVVGVLLALPGSAGAATVVSDSFTDADGRLLQNHVGEVGATWTKHPNYPADFTLHQGRAYGRYWGMYLASGVPPSNEYDVSAELIVKSTGTGSTGVVGRADPSIDSFYMGRFNSANKDWELMKCAGGCTVLATYPDDLLTMGVPHSVKLEIRNSAKTLYVDGIPRASTTDNSITRVGKAGLRQGAANSTSTTGIHVDNFNVSAPDPPPPPPPPPGTVVWDADAEQTADQEWASSCAYPAGAVAPPDMTTPRLTRSSTVRAKGTYSYRSEVRDGDNCYGERAELGQGNPTRAGFENRLFSEGEDRWISWQVYLPTEFALSATTWQVLLQWKQLGALGTPVLSLEARNNQFRLYKSDSNGNTNNSILMWSGAASKNRWVKFTLHVKFSPSASVGFVELFGNPAGGEVVQLLPKTSTYTMKVDGSGTVKSHARIGLYRNTTISGTAAVYYDGYTVATTREAAEANAF